MEHKAKKSLGQNFLKSNKVLFKICEAGELVQDETVLEIGPGKGALTEKLLEKGVRVLAVEKDNDLFEFLKEKFQQEISNKKLILINDDILDFEIPGSLKNYKIIANIPYNITGAIFRKFLEEEKQPSLMILLVQKEVAERIVAKDKKESVLSMSVKAYGEPKYVMTVNKKFFSPSPRVDSAVISIKNISKKNFLNKNQEKIFFDILKTGFAHKRKVVIRNIEKKFQNKQELEKIFDILQINKKSRAEDLSTKDWFDLTNSLKS